MTNAPKPVRLAGCLIQDNEGRLLLLHRNTADHKHWECPGGKSEPGESDGVAAAREVREELNVDVLLNRALGTRTFVDSSGQWTYTWFLARIVAGTPEVREPRVHDQFGYFHPEQLREMYDELSAGMQTLVDEIAAGRINLDRTVAGRTSL